MLHELHPPGVLHPLGTCGSPALGAVPVPRGLYEGGLALKDHGDPVWFTQPLLPPLKERRDLPQMRLPEPSRQGTPPAPQRLFPTEPRRGSTLVGRGFNPGRAGRRD